VKPNGNARQALVCWFTGLSGAGKSSVAEGVLRQLADKRVQALILDGDVVREKMHCDLDFSPSGIVENNRRIAEYCAAIRDQYDVILVPIISPYRASRQHAREILKPRFFEIHCAANLGTVSQRDVKGLYEKARKGEMTNLIGYSPESPYEPPLSPDLTLDTGSESPEQSIRKLACFIEDNLTHHYA